MVTAEPAVEELTIEAVPVEENVCEEKVCEERVYEESVCEEAVDSDTLVITDVAYRNLQVETLRISSKNSLARMAAIPTLSPEADPQGDSTPLQQRQPEQRPPEQRPPEEAIRASLAKALDREMLSLVYQPVIKVSDIEADFYSIEVAARDKSCPYSPREHTALISDHPAGLTLDQWAVEKAVSTIAAVARQGGELQLCLSITRYTQRKADFCGWLSGLLEQQKVNGNRLILSISFEDFMRQPQEAALLAASMQAIDVAVCVSGISSSTQVRQLVETSGIRLLQLSSKVGQGIAQQEALRQELAEIVNIARKQSIRVVATGVDDTAMLSELWKSGVDLMQGAYFQAQPRQLTAAAFAEQVEKLRITA